MLSSGMWRRVDGLLTDVPPKHRLTNYLHDATYQKTAFLSPRRENLKSYIQKYDENIRTDRRLTIDDFIDNVQKCQELFSMAKKAGRRFLWRWNKKHRSQAH
jgi:outer membrane receptor for Fe3+-dicitrate